MGHPYHDGPVTCLDFHPSTPGLIMTGSEDNTARLVSGVNGKVLGTLASHTETVECVGMSGDFPFAASGSLDNKLVVWDLNTLQPRCTLQHPKAVSQMRWIPSTACVYSSCIDGAVRLWDTRAASCQSVMWGHSKGVLDFAISPDMKTVVSASDDHTARVFRMVP